MPGRDIEVRGAGELARELGVDAAAVRDGVGRLVRANADELRRRIQTNAMTGFHGPREGHIPGTGPGPNVVTGDYVNSWQIEYEGEAAAVFTDAPQANRLEYGFHGRDSIGRFFDQPAYPHIEPAYLEIEARVEAQVDALVDLIVRGVR